MAKEIKLDEQIVNAFKEAGLLRIASNRMALTAASQDQELWNAMKVKFKDLNLAGASVNPEEGTLILPFES